MRRPWWVAVTAGLAVAWIAFFNTLLNLTANTFDLGRFRWWLLTGAVICTTGAAVVAGLQMAGSGPRGRVWVDPVEPGRVRRIDLEETLADLIVCAGRGVGVGTALFGAGGFGKTTLAHQVCGHRRVRRAFRSAVWVTLGENPSEGYVREQINDVYFRLSGRRLDAQSVEQAGQELGRLLDRGPKILLVIDDVWRPEHLRPFLHAGKRCTRLVTTRRPGVVSATEGSPLVRVDRFTPTEARTALLNGLSDNGEPARPGDQMETALLRLTGRWPLLVRMANRHLIDEVRGGANLLQAAERLVQRLSAEGPATLRLEDEDSRNHAVAASIGASMDLLLEQEKTAFVRLAVLAEELAPTSEVLGLLWTEIADTSHAVARVCERLDGLSLLARYDRGTSSVRLHEVVRTFLRYQYPSDIVSGHRALVEEARATVPVGAAGTPWHRLPADSYLHRHLCEHLAGAGYSDELTRLLLDLRWIESKLSRPTLGPASLDVDFARTRSPKVAVLRRAIRQAAHLLAPTDPPHSLADIVISRLDGNPGIAEPISQFRAGLPAAVRLTSDRRPSDVSHPALSLILGGHDGPVVLVAVPADGSFIVTAGESATARVWGAAGALRNELPGHVGGIIALAVPADGGFIITASRDRKVHVWESATGVLMHELFWPGTAVKLLAVPADGAFIVTADDRTVRIWDPVAGELLHELAEQTDCVRAVMVPATGSFIVTAYGSGTARVWDPATGALRQELTGHEDAVRLIGAPADGAYVVTASHWAARVWDPATGDLRCELTSRASPITALAVPADGSFVLTAAGDGTARFWDPATGRQRHGVAGPDHRIRSAAVPLDGKLVVTASGRTVRVWNSATGALHHELTGHTSTVNAVSVPADGSFLVSVSDDGTARIWDPTAGPRRSEPIDYVDRPTAIAAKPDGTFVVVAAGRSAEVLDSASGAIRYELTGHTSAVNAVAVPANGAFIVTGSDRGTARIWDSATGQLRHELAGVSGPMTAVVAPADGSFVVTAGRWTARLWNPVNGAFVHELTEHSGLITVVAVPANGAFIIIGSASGTVWLWDPATAKPRLTLPDHTDAVNAAATPADGRFIVTGGDDKKAFVWSPDAGKPLLSLNGHAAPVTAVAVAADGTFVVTVSDRTVRIWDPVTGELRHTLSGHTDSISAVTITADQAFIITAGQDSTIRLWTPSGRSAAMMRTDTPLSQISLLDLNRLVAIGENHLFTFAISQDADPQ